MRVLSHNEIFFSAADKFNDPFDTHFDLIDEDAELSEFVQWGHKLEREGLAPPGAEKAKAFFDVPGYAYEKSDETPRSEYRRRRDEFKVILSQLGIACFSERPDSILMWSHYSQQHKGFCLEFSDLRRHVPADVSFQQVAYRDDMPSLSVKRRARAVVERILRENREKSLGERVRILAQVEQAVRHQAGSLVVTEAVATKHTDWAYEREWRAIIKRPNSVVHYAPQALTTVIFGLRTSIDDRKAVIGALAGPTSGHPPIAEAVRVHGQFAVALRTCATPP